MVASSGIIIGPAGGLIGSTLRGDGVWGVATLRGGTGAETGSRIGLGTGIIRPGMSSDTIFEVAT